MANSPNQCSPNDWNLATNMNHQISNRTEWLNIDNEPVLYGIKQDLLNDMLDAWSHIIHKPRERV